MPHLLLSVLISLFVSQTTTKITTYEIAKTNQTRTTDNYQVQQGTGSQVFRGYVSIYAPKLGSCLGCQTYWENGQAYWIRADGSRFVDDYGIAFNQLPLGTHISLRNIANGKSIGAVVKDTGGFEKYNRIADLTPTVADAIGAETDKSLVEIRAIP